MQNLVGIGVADATEDRRVGEGALQGVPLRGQPPAKLRWSGAQHLQAPGVHGGQCHAVGGRVQRGAVGATGLGDEQGPAIDIDGRKANLLGKSGSVWQPAEAPRNHQVQHEERALEVEDDALSEATQTIDLFPDECVHRGVGGAHQERTGDPNGPHSAADQTGPESVQVEFDVRQLRHRGIVAARGQRPPARVGGRIQPATVFGLC